MGDLFSAEALAVFIQVMGINLVLSGDNAIVIGLAASGLPADQRNKVILFGILAATVLRIIFAVIAVQLLHITGLLLAGGLVLLWVCWKMWHDIRTPHKAVEDAEEALVNQDLNQDHVIAGGVKKTKTFAEAARTIVIADVSMSLDNVLAVAGASYDYPVILAAGLFVSILLMGLAASIIARLLQRYHWLAYLGLAAILYVAVEMIWHGIEDLRGDEDVIETPIDRPEGLPAFVPDPTPAPGGAALVPGPAPAPAPTPAPAP
jgi:YjbE family integral membrane protein